MGALQAEIVAMRNQYNNTINQSTLPLIAINMAHQQLGYYGLQDLAANHAETYYQLMSGRPMLSQSGALPDSLSKIVPNQ